MREIIFRGKRVDNGEWVEGYLAGYDLICPEEPEDAFNSLGTWYGDHVYAGFAEIKPYTVGQYTGLKDLNGKKIFEGDIVKTEFGRLCIFEWFENRVTRCWDLSPILTNTNLLHPAPYKTSIFDSEHLEVVGNIHDNPELLEEKK